MSEYQEQDQEQEQEQEQEQPQEAVEDAAAALGWEVAEALPPAVRGATPALRAMAAQLQDGTSRRVPASPETREQAKVLRKLLAQDGYRLKEREAMFQIGDAPARLYIVVQAVKRNAGNAA